MLSTVAVERLGIPKVHVTDGPNGARGNSFPGAGGPPSTCIPCGSAIGATWNPQTAEALGALVGREALDRGCRGLLAPTVNLHRSPAGRTQLRVLLRGSAPLGRPCRRLRPRGPVERRLRHRQALRRQRRRVRALVHQLGHRRARPARAVPGALRGRGPRGRGAGHHDGVQPAQRALADPAARVPPRHPARRVGLRGPGDDRLVRRGRDDRVARCRTRPRDARTGPGARIRAWSTPSRRATLDEADLDGAVGRLLGGFDRIGALDGPGAGGRSQGADSRRRCAAPAGGGGVDRAPAQRRHPAARAHRSPTRIAVVGPHAVSPTIMGGGSAQVTPHHVASSAHGAG